jgi:hypothetical protein
MPAALPSLVLGTALALGPTTEAPLDVTLVAPDEHADRVAQRLAPRLAAAGFDPEFRRCDDFGCVPARVPGELPAMIVVVSEHTDDTLVIVTRDTPSGVVMVMDEVPVAAPYTILDGEALGFAVMRALTEPPLDRRTTWSEARREGLDRAPPPPAPETPADPATSDARPRPFVQAGVGGNVVLPRFYDRWEALGGPAVAVEAGAVWNPLPRLRLGIGGALAHTSYGPALARSNTDLLAKVRIGVGTPKLWGYAIIGAGLSLVVRDSDYTPPKVGPAAIAGLGVRGRVSRRVSLGFDVESTFVGIPPVGRVVRVSGLLVTAVQFGP